MYLDEGIATLGSWAKLRGLVIRDVVPYGSEKGFPRWAEKYQDRFYYRINDLDEYFSDKEDVTGTTRENANQITSDFLTVLKNSNSYFG